MHWWKELLTPQLKPRRRSLRSCYQRVEGTTIHESASSRGMWFNELYLESDEVGLKGKIDFPDSEGTDLLPV